MAHSHCGQPVAELYHGDDEIVFDIADVCGPATWSAIHHLAENFPCAPCADDAGSLMRFAHDLVNVKIGKPVHFPDDFRKWASVVFETSAELGKLEDAALAQDSTRCELAQDRTAGDIRDEIAGIRDSLDAEPANALVRFVKRSGKSKGEITDFTARQFRELLGKEPPPAIVKPDGKVPWELALDVIASELGYPSDEALKNAIERSLKERRRIDKLERELNLIPAAVCSDIDPSEVPCLEWEGEFCRQKEIVCDGTVITAVRSPIDWSIHITAADEFPDPSNEIDVARRASDAAAVLKELAANPGDRIAAELGQCTGPIACKVG